MPIVTKHAIQHRTTKAYLNAAGVYRRAVSMAKQYDSAELAQPDFDALESFKDAHEVVPVRVMDRTK